MRTDETIVTIVMTLDEADRFVSQLLNAAGRAHEHKAGVVRLTVSNEWVNVYSGYPTSVGGTVWTGLTQ